MERPEPEEKPAALCPENSADALLPTERVEYPNEELLPMVEQLLAEGHTVQLLTKGNSMLPFIHGDRDSVVLQREAAYVPGDIVLARVPSGQYILHRLISIEKGVACLMGDGNIRGREYCPAHHISGRAIRILRPDGTETDCLSPKSLRRARCWQRLLPLRRYLLFLYRHSVGRK